MNPRSSRLGLLVAAGLLGLSGAARAQLVIEEVRVGFSPYPAKTAEEAQPQGYKAGFWTPVFVKVKAGPKDFPGGWLVAETADSDDVQNRISHPLRRLDAGQTRNMVLLTRPGSAGAAVLVSARDKQGTVYPALAAKKTYAPLDLGQQLYLTLGGPLEDFRQALPALDKHRNRPATSLRSRLAYSLDRVEDLPTRGYGYEAVDLLLFPTGGPRQASFLKDLLKDREGRKQALGEWVRRGGRLVIGAGKNAPLAAELLRSWSPAPPPVLTGEVVASPARLEGLTQFAGVQDKPFEAKGKAVWLARLQTGRAEAGPAEALAREGPRLPLVVRFPYGLGSVTLVALDPDGEAFAGWKGRGEFWVKLVSKITPEAVHPAGGDTRGGLLGRKDNDIATDLQWELEQLGVRPVSFGWVAFLIFLYLLVVGPLDYLLLKKVFKRLEWTWVTFPALVLVASAAAFLTVNGLQSKEFRVNKVDLLDIDQMTGGPTVQGTTWFTLYSPRLERYTVGLEPVAPPGVAAGASQPQPSGLVLSWLGRPEDGGFNSYGRQSAQRLFQSEYAFAPGAAGVTGVPVPYGGTKSFTASWEFACPPALTPQLTYEPNNPDRLGGGVINRFPFELKEAALFYGGRWYQFSGGLPSNRFAGLKKEIPSDFNEWARPLVSRGHGDPRPYDPTPVMKHLLFFERLNQGSSRRDNALGRLDQSWRIRDFLDREAFTKEAILFARLPRLHGPGDDVSQSPECLSRLWLGELPGAGRKRPPLPGTLTQDTYLRVFLPVTPRKE
jgi:hypothetical protein